MVLVVADTAALLYVPLPFSVTLDLCNPPTCVAVPMSPRSQCRPRDSRLVLMLRMTPTLKVPRIVKMPVGSGPGPGPGPGPGGGSECCCAPGCDSPFSGSPLTSVSPSTSALPLTSVPPSVPDCPLSLLVPPFQCLPRSLCLPLCVGLDLNAPRPQYVPDLRFSLDLGVTPLMVTLLILSNLSW